MDESDFEGTLVLEKLAGLNLVDAFFEAVDADDLTAVSSLLKRAKVDRETIQVVLKKISNGDED